MNVVALTGWSAGNKALSLILFAFKQIKQTEWKIFDYQSKRWKHEEKISRFKSPKKYTYN